MCILQQVCGILVDIFGKKFLEATGVEHHEIDFAWLGGRAGLRERTFA